ncbi:hypothetical protein ACX3PU_02945 [Chryseobacterium sp. A301]
MNKLFILLILSIPFFHYGQAVRIEPHNTGWFPVDSYQGARVSNLIKVPIHLTSTQGYQMSGWSLRFRVVGPITNGAITINPADLQKIKFQVSTITSSGANDDGMVANLNNVGADLSLIPFSTGSTAIVPYSNFNLQVTNRYLGINLGLDVEMEGGTYLEQYSSWNSYTVNLVFELRNRKGQIMPSGQPAPVAFAMRIHPRDTPPIEQNYLVSLNPNASNVLLEFKTPNDYANGVTQVQPQALSILSETPYFLQVKTLSTDLSSTTSTLPFNSVQLTMKESQSGSTTGSVMLSTTNQTLHSSPAHSTIKGYDLTYFIKPPTDNYGFFNKPYQLYSGTLLFSITPQ